MCRRQRKDCAPFMLDPSRAGETTKILHARPSIAVYSYGCIVRVGADTQIADLLVEKSAHPLETCAPCHFCDPWPKRLSHLPRTHFLTFPSKATKKSFLGWRPRAYGPACNACRTAAAGFSSPLQGSWPTQVRQS